MVSAHRSAFRNYFFRGLPVYWLLPVAVLAVLYFVWIRPWQLRWGATDEEFSRPMPGDDVVKRPHFAATRAVTVDAPPEAIWPWIKQMGFWRAGWYSHDFIDNLGRLSARRILPEYQDLKVVDDIPFTPWNWLGMRVLAEDPGKWMIWQDRQDGGTWLWLLEETPGGRTRMITRRRVRYTWLSPWIVYLFIQDWADIIMMSKCMLGIKRRAEGAQPLGGV